jgi:hypothetical protein
MLAASLSDIRPVRESNRYGVSATPVYVADLYHQIVISSMRSCPVQSILVA